MSPTWRDELDELDSDDEERRNGPPERSNRPAGGRAQKRARRTRSNDVAKRGHAPTSQETHRSIWATAAIVWVCDANRTAKSNHANRSGLEPIRGAVCVMIARRKATLIYTFEEPNDAFAV